jgi:hypothetical protein
MESTTGIFMPAVPPSIALALTESTLMLCTVLAEGIGRVGDDADGVRTNVGSALSDMLDADGAMEARGDAGKQMEAGRDEGLSLSVIRGLMPAVPSRVVLLALSPDSTFICGRVLSEGIGRLGNETDGVGIDLESARREILDADGAIEARRDGGKELEARRGSGVGTCSSNSG